MIRGIESSNLVGIWRDGISPYMEVGQTVSLLLMQGGRRY